MCLPHSGPGAPQRHLNGFVDFPAVDFRIFEDFYRQHEHVLEPLRHATREASGNTCLEST